MRKLSVKQKRMLDECIEQYAADGYQLFSYDQLFNDDLQALEAVSNHETLYMDINRYLMDAKMRLRYQRTS